MTISCSTHILDVTVYGRGAVVTRVVHLPDTLPDAPLSIEVDGVTPLSEGGSVRAVLSAPNRRLVALQSGLSVPPVEAKPGPSVERVRQLTAQIERIQAEVAMVRQQREQIERLLPQPAVKPRLLRAPDHRLADGLAVNTSLHAIATDLDARLLRLSDALEDRRKERDEASLTDQQTSSPDRMGTGHPTRRITLSIDGTGPVESLRLSYVVMPARWWPVYTLRIEHGAAVFRIEGLVAQLTGEDWRDVRIGLSTASLITDLRLPDLPTLRVGRMRPSARRGYRPPPPDLDRMFRGFDEAFPGTVSVMDALDEVGKVVEPAAEMMEADDDFLPQDAPAEKEKKAMGVRMASAGFGGPPPPPMAMPAPSSVMSTLEIPEFAAKTRMIDGARGGAPRQEPPKEIEPADAWLDFDSLRLAGGMDNGRRGRLFRKADPMTASLVQSRINRIERSDPGGGVRDPVESRGVFDHRYDAEGSVDVPSDAHPHRVSLASAEAHTQSRYRAVPLETPEVYREVLMRNPFDAPILDGPVDVYVDGSLLVTSEVGRIDVGGELRVGLGVEERIRISRNVQVDEETTGLLGGTTAVHHTVDVEVRSSLGFAADLEVLDRIPDTDEKNMEVKLVHASPRAEEYSQAERGTPIRGGLIWHLRPEAGGQVKISYGYRITLPSKNEVVGGNRRD